MIDLQLLKWFSPFNTLSVEHIEEVARSARKQTFQKGDMLFKRGRDVKERMFLVKGEVDLIDSLYNVTSLKSGETSTKSALNVESPTTSSGVAKTAVDVLTVDAEFLNQLLSSESETNTAFDSELSGSVLGGFEVEEIDDESEDWMSSLLKSPLFSRIPLSQVQELFMRFEDVHVSRGDLVFKEGARGDYFYVVAAGSARVINRVKSINVDLATGGYFGEEALLGDTPRNASVFMTSDGVLKRLTAEDFAALLKSPVLKYVEDSALEGLGRPYQLIDVRLPMEFRLNHRPGSVNVPLSRLRASLPELGHSDVYIVPDDAGSRADIAAHLLCQAGFDAMILKSHSVSPMEHME